MHFALRLLLRGLERGVLELKKGLGYDNGVTGAFLYLVSCFFSLFGLHYDSLCSGCCPSLLLLWTLEASAGAFFVFDFSLEALRLLGFIAGTGTSSTSKILLL